MYILARCVARINLPSSQNEARNIRVYNPKECNGDGRE